MKDLDKLKKQYEKLGQEIERLEKRPKVRFKPNYGERYWYSIRGMSLVCLSNTFWANDEIDNHHYNIGNCYRTKEEAQHAIDQRLAYVELIDAIADYNAGWWPKCSKDEKYYFYLNTLSWCDEDNLGVSKTIYIEHDPQLYFKDEEGADVISYKLGDEKIKLALGFER